MGHLTVRTDDEVEAALDELTEASGADKSTVVRDAILRASKEMRRAVLRAESARLSEDEDDLAEARRIQEEMAPLRAW